MNDVFASMKRVVAFTGTFGSGKTEVAVNFTEQWARFHPAVSIADLDVVNLYFRSRDVAAHFADLDIRVLAPGGEATMADLPIIVPQVRGALRDPERHLVLDVGGDDLGAKVLASLRDVYDPEHAEVLVVVNANRPFTEDVEGALGTLRSIEAASGLAVTGLVSNTHLMDETTIETIVDGYHMTQELSQAVGLPVRFAAAEGDFAALAAEKLPVPVLELRRRMVTPFYRARPRRVGAGQPLWKT